MGEKDTRMETACGIPTCRVVHGDKVEVTELPWEQEDESEGERESHSEMFHHIIDMKCIRAMTGKQSGGSQ